MQEIEMIEMMEQELDDGNQNDAAGGGHSDDGDCRETGTLGMGTFPDMESDEGIGYNL